MKIVEVTTFPVKLRGPDVYLGAGTREASDQPYYTRPPWRSLYSDRFETVLTRLTCDDGSIGWGEALVPVGPEVVAAIIDRLLAPALLGEDPRRVRPLWTKLSGLMRERGHLVGHQADALAAVDIALWDLAGKAAGVPVHTLLGGAYREEVPVYVSGLPVPTDAERASLAREWREKGATAVKLHLGRGVEEDLATYDAVAASGLRVAVDAHWAYDLSSALRLGKALDERGAWFLEAPLEPEDVEAHRDLAAQLITPVAVGETLRNRFEFRQWIAGRALDLVQPDVGRTGLTEGYAIAELAAAHHLPVAPHHSVGLGVLMAAGLHLSAAIGNLTAFEFQPGTLPVAQSVLATPLPGGATGFPVPTGPGLGVDVVLENSCSV